jgi:glucokinase
MVFVTVSTGIGAGIIIDSRLYRGVNGTAGEIGHTIVNPHSTIRCGCGNYGCLMAHASGLALPQVVRDKLARGRHPGSIDLKSLQDHELTGEVIKRGLDAGDPLCREIVTEYADYLAIGLHNLYQSFNPGLIVLGGGLTEWGPVYLERVEERFYELAREMMYERVEIRLSELGADAAVLGAAALMLEPV